MQYLSGHIFFEEFDIYTLLLFAGIGFLVGFFLRLSSPKAKSKFEKMEKEAKLNEARIAELTEKLETLEKVSKQPGRPGIQPIL